ncbi:MAG TPA: glutaminyl-peptide cyclotransferase [Opitutaceae bacterium]|jgi:glutaminyl-peptide cyclotransferase
MPWHPGTQNRSRRAHLTVPALLAVLAFLFPQARLHAAEGQQAALGEIPTLSYTLVKAWPHDTDAFTEGLLFWNGMLIESTGLYGHSALRKVDLETGRVLQEVRLPARYFGEGIAVLGGRIFQLTWQSHRGFIYDLKTLRQEGDFAFTGEGWGLTTDGRSLIMTDGTNRIRFIDPATFKVTRTIGVVAHGRPVANLNELEYVKGELYANVWQTQFVLRIDPASGRVVASIDFVGILPASETTAHTDVMNGIAYDARDDRLFVTGKDWPRVFEVKVGAE